MLTIGQRIALRLNKLQKRPADLVRGIRVSKGTVSNWISDHNTPKGENLLKLASFLHTSPEWLVTGKGTEELAVVAAPLATYGDLPQNLAGPDKVSIPFYHEVVVNPASAETHIVQDTSTTELLDRQLLEQYGLSAPDIIALCYRSINMEDTILDGSVVFVDTSKSQLPIKDGKIYAFNVSGMLKIYQAFRLAGGAIRLGSRHGGFPDIQVDTTTFARDYQLLGWVFSWSTITRW